MENVSFQFKVIEDQVGENHYSEGCSGSRSDCCTRVCKKDINNASNDSLQAWDDYLDVNAGVLQY
jgi:hypothetical protein